jgi:hypothetical protein
MIDVDDRRALQPGDPGPLQRTAFHHQYRIDAVGDFGSGTDGLDGGKRLQERRRHAVHYHCGVLAKRAERQAHADGGTNGVAIGPLVGRDVKALTSVNRRQ